MEIKDYVMIASACINFCGFILNLWGKIEESKRTKREREGV